MTKIEWTDETWNPTTGCTWKSPECDNCYAVAMSRRLEAMGQERYAGINGRGHFNGVVRTHESVLEEPFRWRKPRRIFVNSMSDLFHPGVDPAFIARVFATMYACQWHTFQILTKRPQRLALLGNPRFPWAVAMATWQMMAERDPEKAEVLTRNDLVADVNALWPLPNVWIGTSVGVRDCLHRIETLRQVEAAVRWLSLEPLLEDLGELDLTGIDWVVCGGESGPHARPMHPDWARLIRNRCQAAGVPFFFKQWGLWKPVTYEPGHWPESHSRFTFPDGQQLSRVGKKQAGHLLDGEEWQQFPQVEGVGA